jgi:transglutaminase-like putative cysteine protease
LLDLARGKRGVCRHRAYAFVIVAQALGIPARFVQNEAHAWVEYQGTALNEAEGMHQHFAAFDEALAAAPPEGL